MIFKRSLPVALLLAAATAAQAQAPSGVYLGAGLGINVAEDTLSRSANTRFSSALGGAALASIGWGFGSGFRVELEAGFRGQPVESIGVRRVNGQVLPSPSSGWTGNSTVMANLLYEFDLRRWRIPVQPYVGAGIGYGWRHHAAQAMGFVSLPAGNADATNRYRDTGGALAYQAIGGLAWPVAAVPGLAVTAEYRYARLEEAKLVSVRSVAAIPGSPAFSSRGAGYFGSVNHSALIGLRYNFGAVRPAVAVSEPPVQRLSAIRTLLIFFDWNSTALTDRARQIIREAPPVARQNGATTFQVSGHADRSGSDTYNQALSRRRADAVAAELVRLGVPRETITIRGFGESQPLVYTADGAREPQNRRVEIVFR